MANRPFRFLHASDFHLEAVPSGLGEVPDHVRALMADAPFRAAERVFDAAEQEHVDCVILSGNLVDPTACGPRGLTFLIQQFERLAAAEIGIYWAGGKIDSPERWPSQIPLPENVRHFSSDVAERFIHDRDDQPLLRVVGQSSTGRGHGSMSEWADDDDGLFTVGVVNGEFDPTSLRRQHVHYWALGGKHRRRTLTSSPHVVHYPGSPQGRNAREHGPHGCTIVSVDDLGRPKPAFLATDTLRWHEEKIVIPDRTAKNAIERLLDERTAALWNSGRGPDLLVKWTLAGPQALVASLRRGKLGSELLSRLRSDYGQKRPMLWSLAVEADHEIPLPDSYYAQQSVLGEFLRTVREIAAQPSESLELAQYLPERHQGGSIATAVKLDDEELRADVLREVALLGMDLLKGEELET